MPVPTQSLLDITAVCVSARWRVVAQGELDLSSGPHLVAVSHVLAESRAAAVDLDLGDVTFIDTAGWKAVIAARAWIEQAGGSFTLTAQSAAVEHFRRLSADLIAAPSARRGALATAG